MLETLARGTSAKLDEQRAQLRRIIQEKSLITGTDFTLASGRHSSFFFDMKKTMFNPEGISLIADILYGMVESERDVWHVGGLEIGAVPIVTAVCMHSHGKARSLAGFFVRKEVKDHGIKERLGGIAPSGKPVILFDDVTTTGGSVMQAVEAVRARDCSVRKVITVVDRLEGAADSLKDAGLSFDAVFTLEEFDKRACAGG
jgi:orotate phosphoribosyltransferase